MKTLNGRDICEVDDLPEIEEMRFLGREYDSASGEYVPVWDLTDRELNIEEIEELFND